MELPSVHNCCSSPAFIAASQAQHKQPELMQKTPFLSLSELALLVHCCLFLQPTDTAYSVFFQRPFVRKSVLHTPNPENTVIQANKHTNPKPLPLSLPSLLKTALSSRVDLGLNSRMAVMGSVRQTIA